MKKFVALLVYLLLSGPLWAQRGVALSASVDKSTILIGEPLQLTLQATFSKAHAPAAFRIDSFLHFEILGRSAIDSQTASGNTVLKQTVSLTSWDSGAWVIPALAVVGIRGASTKPVMIHVTHTPAPPTQDYHDIKDIIEVQKEERTTWYWYIIGAALLLLLILLIFPRKKKDAAADAVAIAEGAYKTALKNLDLLRAKPALDNNAYFTELIEIFRTYLQHAKGIHSFQQTTGDLSRQLQALTLPHEDFKKLVETLQLSDIVKFAQYTPNASERDAAWSDVRKNITAIEGLPK